MKKILFLCLVIAQALHAQKMQTLTYFSNDTLKLELDLFTPDKAVKEKMPVVLFVHGGGFAGGERKDGHPFCKYLAQNGIASASITYTLYMKGKKFSCDGALTEKVRAFRYGANDLWLATAFLLKNSDKLNLDPSKIFISGSSAGGETVLQAAYWDRKLMKMYDLGLPDDFKYAGLISGAGALMDINLVTKKTLLPMFFFHGNGDSTVPYGTAAHHYCPTDSSGWLMLFGSYSLFNKAKELDGSTELYTFCGGGHEYSGTLFEKDQNIILDFIRNVLAGEKMQSHTIVKTGKRNEKSAAYSFCD